MLEFKNSLNLAFIFPPKNAGLRFNFLFIIRTFNSLGFNLLEKYGHNYFGMPEKKVKTEQCKKDLRKYLRDLLIYANKSQILPWLNEL
ncbi:hypothetical protein DOM21_14530 [Bacteriovorax stolpii]|uniref:Uncharacterized protein n=1 Tax=Bacteriovorax stolpii TaxID=960 RepID=A0A2K9NPF3_BACTC|nr:hypothetical protein C0V70_04525 [Bacteriovorax stolpii]QDK42643.1 hypothetical protein DOM21_14530 [Bacteriovorax stolpii]